MGGLWNCEYKYSSAEFSDKVQFKDLQRDPNVAGFRKYSVASMPDIGKDVVTTRRFIERDDGNIVEDVGYNLKAMVESALLIMTTVIVKPMERLNYLSIVKRR